ncbi:hypothetical protein [Nonomuraea dietziae]|uniref:Uncharacterized protein n=2 Tax=Nonomuraea dietziae TaxID=65515 RepID=A0A7W5V005_9ACTN|nr:hypothetical protein [Nonomuraea dietziae]MBB3725165.1 hypothetical protein [Nonomuraea dietziae]
MTVEENVACGPRPRERPKDGTSPSNTAARRTPATGSTAGLTAERFTVIVKDTGVA